MLMLFHLSRFIVFCSDNADRFLKLASAAVGRCQPWFYLRLMAYWFFGLSESAFRERIGLTQRLGLGADKDGNRYGTTHAGGAGYNARGSGCGTIFEIKPPTLRGRPFAIQRCLPVPGTERYRRRRSPPAVQGGAWTETILYNFTNSDQSIGLRPPFPFSICRETCMARVR
jgi:hypothetical protein